jgi:hypothetical protein
MLTSYDNFEIGRNMYQQNRYKEVRETAMEILRIHEQIDGVDHLNTALALGNVGSVNYRLNFLKECEYAMQRVLYILR